MNFKEIIGFLEAMAKDEKDLNTKIILDMMTKALEEKRKDYGLFIILCYGELFAILFLALRLLMEV
jgi:hypothetical protein